MKRPFMAAAVLSSVLMAGCATVTATPEGQPKLASTPQFEQTQSFFFWGLTPERNTVDVAEVCAGSGVRQIQTQSTFEDGLFSVVTLGIYSPRTSRVWCE